MPPKTLIIIVNYKTPELVVQCLDALIPQLDDQTSVCLVENDSRDLSLAIFQDALRQKKWENKVSLLPLTENKGFAAGNNAAIRRSLKDNLKPVYYLLLNPDTIPQPRAIDTLVEFMDDHPRCGIAGSSLLDENHLPQTSAFRFPSILSELENGLRLGIASKLLSSWTVPLPPLNTPERVGWVSGASLIFRSQLIDDIGFMDEKFFLYYEEVDYCLKAQKAGWECWSVPASKVVHLGSQSTQLNNQQNTPKPIPKYWFEARKRFFIKNYGRIYTLLADSAWMLGFASWRLRRILQNKPDTDPPHMLRDFFQHSAFFY